MSAETLTAPADTEHARVVAWRLSTLLDAGYPLELAERLAAHTSTVDLHRAVRLVKQGASPELAAAILE